MGFDISIMAVTRDLHFGLKTGSGEFCLFCEFSLKNDYTLIVIVNGNLFFFFDQQEVYLPKNLLIILNFRPKFKWFLTTRRRFHIQNDTNKWWYTVWPTKLLSITVMLCPPCWILNFIYNQVFLSTPYILLGFPAGLSRPGKSREGPGTGRDRKGPRDLEGPVVLWSRD